MAKETVWFFVNGILTWPGRSSNWTGRAVTHTMAHHPDLKAEKVEYFSFATIDRVLGQRRRIDLMQQTMQEYLNKNFYIHIAAHSNGTDVVLDTLDWLKWPQVESLHLLAPACQADFGKNGLNQALRNNSLGTAHVYLGKKDWPMRFAKSWLGRCFYDKPLGYYGPLHVDQDIASVKKRVVIHEREDFGHSDWFGMDNFSRTLGMVLGNHST